jgi:hypothetical protein
MVHIHINHVIAIIINPSPLSLALHDTLDYSIVAIPLHGPYPSPSLIRLRSIHKAVAVVVHPIKAVLATPG